MAMTYAEYLRINELLSQQKPRSDGPEHDEMLFIIIHQVYELWFKQILHELNFLNQSLRSDQANLALRTFKRVLTIMKTLVAQVDVLETMSPLSFLSFRDRLDTASGFQSVQFRELEIRLGARDTTLLSKLAEADKPRINAMLAEPSLYDAFLQFLAAQKYRIPQEILSRDFRTAATNQPAVLSVLHDVYRDAGTASQIAELMVDLDEGLQEWRYRHVKMVERTIGNKTGTGGSLGAKYLQGTLFKALWPDLWEVRTKF